MHYEMHCEMHYAMMLARSVLASCVLDRQKGDVFVEQLREMEGTRSRGLLIFRCSEAVGPIAAVAGWSDFDPKAAVHFGSCQIEN
jgi:hypothetical protein